MHAEPPGGISNIWRVGALADTANLTDRKLLAKPRKTCASPSHLEKHGTPQIVEEIDNHICLYFLNRRTGRPLPWFFKGVQRLNLTGSIVIKDAHAAGRAVISG
jgi:LysR family transcriptional regulator for bpeEF and oprC